MKGVRVERTLNICSISFLRRPSFELPTDLRFLLEPISDCFTGGLETIGRDCKPATLLC